jgi:hypothetical protein
MPGVGRRLRGWRKPQPGWALAAIAAGLGALAVWFHLGRVAAGVGPEQPIPFSHRLHADDKGIGCVFCHTGVGRTANAGIPPVETCLLCHRRILVAYPHVRELTRFSEARPLEWVRVFHVCDFVYFEHAAHMLRGIDCGTCHGDVRHMDRLVEGEEFDMGFCVDCHRENRASDDCLTCHR